MSISWRSSGLAAVETLGCRDPDVMHLESNMAPRLQERAAGAPDAGMIPLPAELQDSLRINWHLTLWCNYSCPYCPVLVFHQRSAAKARQEHSFDYYTADQWLQALSQFPQRHIHLKITGGEPFLDRKNFRALLAGLSEMKHIRRGLRAVGRGGVLRQCFPDDPDGTVPFAQRTHRSRAEFAGPLRHAARSSFQAAAATHEKAGPVSIRP